MIASLIAGLLLGLAAGLSPGPLLTLVITQTLKHNRREGIKTALVPLLTDPPIILLTTLVLSRLTQFNFWLGLLSLAGAGMVCWLAYESWRSGPVTFTLATPQAQSIKQGALVNLLSPHPYLFWLTVGASTMASAARVSRWAAAAFVAGFYLLLVGCKVVLALLVERSRAWLTGSWYVRVLRGLAVLLFGFALRLCWDALKLLGAIG